MSHSILYNPSVKSTKNETKGQGYANTNYITFLTMTSSF
jgi:hypothetical protein